MTLQTERLHTVEQIRGFLDRSGEVDFRLLDRDGASCGGHFRLEYDALGRAGKGTVRRFLLKATGPLCAQVARLIRQHRETGRVEDRRGANSERPFACVYAADTRLLAEADEVGAHLCGPAAREVLRRNGLPDIQNLPANGGVRDFLHGRRRAIRAADEARA